MQVVPVIDIRNSVAVRAVAGRRTDYRPLETPLAETSDPLDVARGLMALYDFSALYIADLDAIEGRGSNWSAISEIRGACPGLSLWIDAGVKTATEARRLLARERFDVVLGSESFADMAAMEELAADPRIILSLDFKGESFLGERVLLEDPSSWPERVIVMTLARVGAGAGPDLARLRATVLRAGDRRVFAAGGVRGPGDLADIDAAGGAGALVATALHEGSVRRADLVGWKRKQKGSPKAPL